jgi:hypothetical protein
LTAARAAQILDQQSLFNQRSLGPISAGPKVRL